MKLRMSANVLALAILAGSVPALADPLPPPQHPAKKKQKGKDGDKKPADGTKGESKPKS